MFQMFTKTKVSCYKDLQKNKSIMLQRFAEKQKYHVTVRIGLRNLAVLFEISAEALSGQ